MKDKTKNIIEKATEGDLMDHTLTALSLSGKANAVSKMHLHTIQQKWKNASGLCEILAITNGQNYNYWADTSMQDIIPAFDSNRMADEYYKKLYMA
jgi:starch phosphorylase